MSEATNSSFVSGGNAVTTIFDKISFVQKYPVLMKATEDNETPTPGYLYDEINNLTFQSGCYCQSLLDFLNERLSKNSYHVKLKVLRIMKHLVHNGHLDFRQSLRQNAHRIKINQGFNGPPHLLQGNAPHILVRTAAKELLKILFDTELMNQECQLMDCLTEPVKPVLGGLGSMSSSGKMEGFGSVPINPVKSLAEKIITGLTELADKVTGVPEDSLEIRHSNIDRNFGDYEPIKVDNLGDMFSEQIKPVNSSNKLPSQNKIISPDFFSNHAGGGWEDQPEDNHSYNSVKSINSGDSSDKIEAVGASDWAVEMQLIDDFILAPDNIFPEWSSETYFKFIQSWDEKKKFQQRCYSLNSLKIAELINDRLANENCHLLLRSIVAAEVIVQHEVVPSETLLAIFKDNLDMIQKHHEEIIRNKAKKIYLILHNRILEYQQLNEACEVNS